MCSRLDAQFAWAAGGRSRHTRAVAVGAAAGGRSVGRRAPRALCVLGDLRSNSVSEPQANGEDPPTPLGA